MSSLPNFKWEDNLSSQALAYIGGIETGSASGQPVPMTEGHIAAMKFAYQASLLKGTHNLMSKADSFRIMDYTAGVPLLFQFDGERTGPYPQEGTPLIYYGTVSEVKKKVQAQVLTITRTNNLDEDSLKRQILMSIVDGTARVELTNFIESWESTAADDMDIVSTDRSEILVREKWEAIEGIDLDHLESLEPRPKRTRIVIREGGEETKTSESSESRRARHPPPPGGPAPAVTGQEEQEPAVIQTRSRKRRHAEDTSADEATLLHDSQEHSEGDERRVVTQEFEEEIPEREYSLKEAEWMKRRADLLSDAIKNLRARYSEELSSGDYTERGGVIFRKQLIRSTPSTSSLSIHSKKKTECTYQVICDYLAAAYKELDGQAIRDLDKRIREFPPWNGSVTPIARLSALRMLMIRLEKVQSVEAVNAKFAGADVYKLYRAGFTPEFELSLSNFMGNTMDTMEYTEVLNKLHRCLISISKMNPFYYQAIMNHVSSCKSTKTPANLPLPHKAPILSTGPESGTMQTLQDQLQRLESRMESHFSAIAGGAVQQARQQDKSVKNGKQGKKGEQGKKRGGGIDTELLKKKISEALSGRMDLKRNEVILCFRCNYFRPRSHIQQGCYVATKSEVTAEKSPHNSYPITDKAYQDLVKEEELNQKLFQSAHSGMSPREFFKQQNKSKQSLNSKGGR